MTIETEKETRDNANQFFLGTLGKGTSFILKKEDLIGAKTNDDIINNALKRTCQKKEKTK
jgi:hypothetical protein